MAATIFKHFMIPILVAILGIAATVLASVAADRAQKRLVVTELKASQRIWVSLMEFSTAKDITLAQTLVSVFNETPIIDQPAFNQLSENAIKLYPNLEALFFVPAVNRHQRSTIETAIRSYHREFSFKDYAGPAGFIPAQQKEKYYPVTYLNGSDSSGNYLGWDLAGFGELGAMFSDLEKTDDTVAMRFIPSIDNLLNPGSLRPVLQILLASPLKSPVILANGEPHTDRGYLVFLVDFSPLVNYFSDYPGADKLHISVTMGNGSNKRTVFEVPPKSGTVNPNYFTKAVFSNRAASNWEVTLTPTDEFFSDKGNSSKYWVFATGLSITLMLAFYLFTVQRRTAIIQALVEQRTDELQKANRELDRLSRTDYLTGIANRRFFEENFEREWIRATRGKYSISLMMIDVDCFKTYNDRYGHIEGDYCLQKIVKALTITVKRPADQVARFGGEEFVILLPETENGGMALAERCRQAVEQLQIEHLDSNISDYVTISIGVATLTPTDRQPSRTLIKAADDALYQAKNSGRNQVREG